MITRKTFDKAKKLRAELSDLEEVIFQEAMTVAKRMSELRGEEVEDEGDYYYEGFGEYVNHDDNPYASLPRVYEAVQLSTWESGDEEHLLIPVQYLLDKDWEESYLNLVEARKRWNAEKKLKRHKEEQTRREIAERAEYERLKAKFEGEKK